ncbi:hypothetical protein HKD37_04G010726 [Glycine soja]
MAHAGSSPLHGKQCCAAALPSFGRLFDTFLLLCLRLVDFSTFFSLRSHSTTIAYRRRLSRHPHAQPTQTTAARDPMQGPWCVKFMHTMHDTSSARVTLIFSPSGSRHPIWIFVLFSRVNSTHCHRQRLSHHPRAQPTQNTAAHGPMQGPGTSSSHKRHIDSM